MKKQHYVLILLLLVLLPACLSKAEREARRWRITLDKDDKKPYGTYLAYNSLQYFFPGSNVVSLSNSNQFDYMSSDMMHPEQGSNLLVLDGLTFNISDDEWTQLKAFVRAGNELVIFCSQLDDDVSHELNCFKSAGRERFPMYKVEDDAGDDANTLTLANMPGKSFGYMGRYIRGHFYQAHNQYWQHADTTKKDATVNEAPAADSASVAADTSAVDEDSSYADASSTSATDSVTMQGDTLGCVRGLPNMVRFRLGYGHITLHAAPLVTSNYFLLQPGNINYLTGIWRTLPGNINRIYWQNYFDHYPGHFSFSQLLRSAAARWAFWLGLLTITLYILFQLKRRQRVIPIIPPLRNDSVAFVETVGRLYYNKGNHVNLAEKMTQQFLEWVRVHYYLNTNVLNDEFVRNLSAKSGQPISLVKEMVQMIAEVRDGYMQPNDDAYLYHLYNTIQHFYNKQP